MHARRIESVRIQLRDRGLDSFLFSSPPDIRWACGFTGSDALLVVAPDSVDLVTDGRYRDQAASELSVGSVHIHGGSAIEFIAESGLLKAGESVGIDSWCVTVDFAGRLETMVPKTRVVPQPRPFREFIASKDPTEIKALRKAQAVTDSVFEEILGILRPGLTELEVASEIVYRHLQRGADEMSFPPIVGSGPNGALPHARPSNRVLTMGDLVVLDFGCFVNGYASDMTRTVAIGKPSDDAARAYEVVLSAQSAAEQAACSGLLASDLDGIARDMIDAAGYGGAFTHGLGHGLGLRVHEWPRIGRNCDEPLPENCVITIEPGVYISNEFGIRIENSVVVNSKGNDPLPSSTTSLIVL